MAGLAAERAPRAGIAIGYPLVPWIGVMAAGYAFGPILLMPAHRRQQLLLSWGMAIIAAFILLRLYNGYGDPAMDTAGNRVVHVAVVSEYDKISSIPALPADDVRANAHTAGDIRTLANPA